MKAKVLKYISAKGKNKRIEILLYEAEDKSKFFTISTKTLQDFKTRNITKTYNSYSVETFVLISQLMDLFLEEPSIANKLLVREIDKIQKFKVYSDIKEL